MFKFHDGIIERSKNQEIPDFDLKVETNKSYSYDSPLSMKLKEEEEIKALNYYKEKNGNYSKTNSRENFQRSPLKNENYGQNLYSSNILVIFLCENFQEIQRKIKNLIG